MSDTNQLGPQGEELACVYLQEQGYTILERNYRNRVGEIDIVAKEGEHYCFVEVKAREDDEWGDPLEAITPDKQYRLHKTALGYIQEKDIFDEYARFDVVGILFGINPPKISLVKNAFEVSSL